MRITFFILLSLLSLQASAQFHTNLGSINPWEQKSVNLKDVLKDPKLTCSDTNYRVVSFSVSLYINERLEVDGPLLVRGNQFDQATIDMVRRNMNNSGKLYIDEIKVMGPDKRQRSMPFIELKFP